MLFGLRSFKVSLVIHALFGVFGGSFASLHEKPQARSKEIGKQGLVWSPRLEMIWALKGLFLGHSLLFKHICLSSQLLIFSFPRCFRSFSIWFALFIRASIRSPKK